MARTYQTTLGTVSAEKITAEYLAIGYEYVVRFNGIYIGRAEKTSEGFEYAMFRNGGGATSPTLKGACEALAQYAKKVFEAQAAARLEEKEAAWKTELEAADADAQASEQVAENTPLHLREPQYFHTSKGYVKISGLCVFHARYADGTVSEIVMCKAPQTHIDDLAAFAEKTACEFIARKPFFSDKLYIITEPQATNAGWQEIAITPNTDGVIPYDEEREAIRAAVARERQKALDALNAELDAEYNPQLEKIEKEWREESAAADNSHATQAAYYKYSYRQLKHTMERIDAFRSKYVLLDMQYSRILSDRLDNLRDKYRNAQH